MMPSTVPNSPTKGALFPSVPRNERNRSYCGRSGRRWRRSPARPCPGPGEARQRPRGAPRLHAPACPRAADARPSSSPRARPGRSASASLKPPGGEEDRRSSISARESTESATSSQSTHSALERVTPSSLPVSQPMSASARTEENHGVGVVRPRNQTDSTVQAASADARLLHPPGTVVMRPDDVGRRDLASP